MVGLLKSSYNNMSRYIVININWCIVNWNVLVLAGKNALYTCIWVCEILNSFVL